LPTVSVVAVAFVVTLVGFSLATNVVIAGNARAENAAAKGKAKETGIQQSERDK